MRAKFLTAGLLLMVVLSSACERRVLVQITGAPSEVAILRVTTQIGEHTEQKNTDKFQFLWDPREASGILTLQVNAFDSEQQCELATGSIQVDVPKVVVTPIAVTVPLTELMPTRCALTVAAQGPAGRVVSTPPGIDCLLARQDDSPPVPAGCRSYFDIGTAVTLTVVHGEDPMMSDAPLNAHWRAGCVKNGTSCVLPVGKGGARAAVRLWRNRLPNMTSLYGVSGRSESDVLAVGTTGKQSLIAHFDGREWIELPGKWRQSPTTLRAVWVGASGEAWVVGDGGAIWKRATDGSWSEEGGAGLTTADLYGVYGSIENHQTTVFAVGRSTTLLERIGSSWRANSSVADTVRIPGGNPDNLTLRGVWTGPSSGLWVLGEEHQLFVGQPGGTQWLISETSAVPTSGIWGSSDGERSVWIVGEEAFLQRFSLPTRAQERPWPPGIAKPNLHGVWGLSSGTEFWAVGDGGTVLHRKNQTWSQEPTRTMASLKGAWGPSREEIWLVGISGSNASIICHPDQ